MKRIRKLAVGFCAVFLSAVMAASVLATSSKAVSPHSIYGDVAVDNDINSIDALYILRNVVGLEPFTEEQFVAADVDGDGQITASDALHILRYIVGVITVFPVEESEWLVESLSDTTAELVGYDGTVPTELFIPSTVGGKKIVSVAAGAFAGQSSLTKVIFPEGLTTVKSRAFADCSNLTALSVPISLVNIAEDAFSGSPISQYEYTGVRRGIDISRWNGEVDFEAVKASGIEFVIIRAGYGNLLSQKDPKFEANYAAAKAAGLDVGTYWYSYADSVADARLEAEVFLQAVAGKQFEYPLYMDFEDSSQYKYTKRQRTDMVIAALTVLEQARCYAGLYCTPYWIDDLLYKDELTQYDKWLAHYAAFPRYRNEYGGVWQFSETGTCAGVTGNVDLDYAYRDYPTIIKNAHLNGF